MELDEDEELDKEEEEEVMNSKNLLAVSIPAVSTR